jgi:hypothetical protein
VDVSVRAAAPTINASSMLGAIRADTLDFTTRCAAKAKVVKMAVIWVRI